MSISNSRTILTKVFVVFFCSLLISGLLLSGLYAYSHHNHKHVNKSLCNNCAICAVLSATFKLLKSMSLLFSIALAGLLFAWVTASIFYTTFTKWSFLGLASLKTRMNN